MMKTQKIQMMLILYTIETKNFKSKLGADFLKAQMTYFEVSLVSNY